MVTPQKRRSLSLIAKRQFKNWRSIAEVDGSVLDSRSSAGRFIERYFVCEAIARKLISDKMGKPCPQTLNFASIHSAVNYLGLGSSIHRKLIEDIFRSGEGAPNHRTPRQLRNGVVHGLAKQHLSEISHRIDDLMNLMQCWLQHFR